MATYTRLLQKCPTDRAPTSVYSSREATTLYRLDDTGPRWTQDLMGITSRRVGEIHGMEEVRGSTPLSPTQYKAGLE